jgi:tetratricopeptide (TPR) repeat protein
MKTVILSSFATIFATLVVNAQDIEQVKKTIDAEKFSDARKSLKSMIAASPDKGKNYFYLGQVYIALEKQDSAKVYFDKGKAVKDAGHLNLIGLGQLELLDGNKSAAETHFTNALAFAKKKNTEEQIFISQAYLKATTPDNSKALTAAKAAVTADPKSASAQVALGDALVANKNVNDAYVAYRTAGELDKTLVRAQLQLAVITRNAQAFPQALEAFNGILAANPSYGPAFREKAETNLAWAYSKKSVFDEKIAAALVDYKKYMSLTDVSTDARMKYADFLILSKKWKELETEALEIQKTDKESPKVYKYLGYAYSENGNPEGAVKSLSGYMSKVDPKRISGKDYLYLAKAKLATSMDDKGIVSNSTKFNEAIADLTKAAELSPYLNAEFTEIGIKLYTGKAYLEASKLFELAVKNTGSKSFARDNYLLGNSILFYADGKSAAQKAALTVEFAKANKAYDESIKAAPSNVQDVYFYKAQLNRVIGTTESNAQAVLDYEGFVKTVVAKGDAEITKPAVKENLFDAYSFIGANYATTDKVRAIENFKKAAEINPADTFVKESLQALNK